MAAFEEEILRIRRMAPDDGGLSAVYVSSGGSGERGAWIHLTLSDLDENNNIFDWLAPVSTPG